VLQCAHLISLLRIELGAEASAMAEDIPIERTLPSAKSPEHGEESVAMANGSSLERIGDEPTKGDIMAYTTREAAYDETAAYGGLADAVGGVATIVLAVVGLAGVHGPMMAAIATIVFGIALLIQGGTMLSEFAAIYSPPGVKSTVSADQFGGASLSVLFLVGAGGIVLGVLALLGIEPAVLTPIASIAFGTALVLTSNSVWHLFALRRAATKGETQTSENIGREILASDMAAGSAGIQALAGLAVIVLGILAVAGNRADLTLNLIALLTLGGTVVLTGGSLSATVLGLMRPWQQQ
jgi:hypothetical protein